MATASGYLEYEPCQVGFVLALPLGCGMQMLPARYVKAI